MYQENFMTIHPITSGRFFADSMNIRKQTEGNGNVNLPNGPLTQTGEFSKQNMLFANSLNATRSNDPILSHGIGQLNLLA